MKLYATDIVCLFGTPLGNILALDEIVRKHGPGLHDDRGRFWHLSNEELREVSERVAAQALHPQ